MLRACLRGANATARVRRVPSQLTTAVNHHIALACCHSVTDSMPQGVLTDCNGNKFE